MPKSKHYDWVIGGALPELARHSAVKHSLLRDYLVDYFLTLVSSPHQDKIKLTVVDGFCGGGRYRSETGEIVPGSPIVILDAVKEAQVRVLHDQKRRKPIEFDVELICVDADRSALKHLRHVLEEHGYGAELRSGKVKTIHGTFTSQAEAVINAAHARTPNAGRAIFVLDQYGYDKVPVRVMREIFQNLKRAEIILTFNVDSLISFLSPKNVQDFERKTGVIGAITAADLDKSLRTPTWRLNLQASLYQKITEGSGASYFTPFFIRPQVGHGDFWLLHLAQHWKARDVMAAAHWKHHNHFVHYGRAGFDMLSTGYAAGLDDEARPQVAFEFDQLASVASKNDMMEQIPQALDLCREGVPFKKFFIDRVNSTPATEEMVERAVLQLVRDRQVEVIGEDGSVRNVRTAIQAEHILRLPGQRVFTFG